MNVLIYQEFHLSIAKLPRGQFLPGTPVWADILRKKGWAREFRDYRILVSWNQEFLSVIKGVSLFDSAQRENKPATLPFSVNQNFDFGFYQTLATPLS